MFAALGILAVLFGAAFFAAADFDFSRRPPRQDKSRIPFVAWVPEK